MNQISTPIVTIGFGSQAKAWSLNLRDSGYDVSVALREGSTSFTLVEDLNFPLINLDSGSLPPKAIILLLIPDLEIGGFLEKYSSLFSKDSKMIYAHGYSFIDKNLHKKYPQFSHLLLAPKAIASEVRFQYETKGKLGAVYSLEASTNPDEDKDILFSLAKGIGITGGPYKASFQEETYADLFSEQALLCGLIPYASLHCFNKLIEKGIPEELAYMECWLEVKLISDAMVKMGPEEFFKLISPNALIGGEKAQKQLLSPDFLKTLDGLIEEIWDKSFFKHCRDQNIEELKLTVQKFWGEQELNRVHKKLSKDLF